MGLLGTPSVHKTQVRVEVCVCGATAQKYFITEEEINQ